MSGASSNDNGSPDSEAARREDVHGRAAILLIESLIHGLIEESLISVSKAVEIIEAATEVSRNMEEELGDRPVTARLPPSALLEAMSKSLSYDLPINGQ